MSAIHPSHILACIYHIAELSLKIEYIKDTQEAKWQLSPCVLAIVSYIYTVYIYVIYISSNTLTCVSLELS